MDLLKDLLLLSFILLLCGGWGRWGLKRLGLALPDGLEGLLYGAAAGLLSAAYAVLLLGYAGWLSPPSLWLLGAVFLGLGWTELRKIASTLGEAIGSLRPQAGPQGRVEPALPDRSRVPWGRISGVGLGLFLLCAALNLSFNHVPPTEGDERIYHLALPQIYAQEGRIVDRPDNWANHYPLTGEMIFTMGMVLGGPGLARLWSWGFGLLAALAVFCLARIWFPRSEAPGLALGLYYTFPLCTTISGSAFPDQWMVLCGVLAVCAMMRWEKSGWDLRWICASGFFAGAGLSARYTGVAMVAAVFFGALYLYRRASRIILSRPLLRQMSAWACFVILAACPWWIRNAWITGNPFYPLHLIAGLPYDALFQYWFQDCNAGGSGKEGMATIGYWRDILHGIFFGNITLGSGPLPLMTIPLLALLRPRPPVLSTAGVLMGTSFLITSCLLLPLPARYQIFLFPFLAILSAYSMENTLAALRGVPRFRKLVSLLFLIPLLFPHLFLSAYFGGTRLPLHLGWINEEQYLERKLDDADETYPVMRFIQEKVPAGESILALGGGGYQYGYPHHTQLSMGAYPMDFWREEPQHALRRLRRDGVRYLLAIDATVDSEGRFLYFLPRCDFRVTWLKPAVDSGMLELAFSYRGRKLYRLRAEEGSW